MLLTRRNFNQICTQLMLLFFIHSMSLSAQTVDAKIVPPKPIPPSPDVASLFKFSELPVTLYTGLPSVSVPMFEIKLNELTIPISLDYHTGGVKVDELSSTVGMGWTLTAGGSLNSLIRGKDDMNNGYPGSYPITKEIYEGHGLYNPSMPNGGPSYTWCQDIIMNGLSDSEPDMFNFSAPGISGKFFFGVEGGIHTVPVQPIKVLFYDGEGNKIVSEKGVKYYFNQLETSFSSSGTTNNNYYLSRIITPSRDTVNYIYEAVNYSYKNFFGESRLKYVSGYNSPRLLMMAQDVVNGKPLYDSVRVTGLRIKSINCTNGARIDFNYASAFRKDLKGTNALSEVSLYYKTAFIKKFVMVQEYRGDTTAPDKCRLWLSQVYEEGKNGLKVAPYKFFYDPKALPDRLSNGQDHWGYANGGGGSSRLPPNDEYWLEEGGAKRWADTLFSRAGLMTSLRYPTGGTTEFVYEPNDVWVENERSVKYNSFSEGVYSSPYTVTQRSFTIPAGTYLQRLFYNTYASPPSSGGGGIENPPEGGENDCYITVTKPNGQSVEYSTRNSNPNGETVNWAPGLYTVTINSPGDNNNGFLELRYKKNDTTYFTGPKIVGGWRIKKLTYKDAYNVAANRSYRYSYAISDAAPGHSSGELAVINPQYEYLRNLVIRPYTMQIIMQSANSVLPLWNDHGHIFYPIVTVYDGENGENGKRIYNYSYTPNSGGYYGYPFVPSRNNDWASGSLLKKEAFRKNADGTYKLIETTENKYSVGPDSIYWREMYDMPEPPGVLKGLGLVVTQVAAVEDANHALFEMFDYSYVSAWLRLDSTVVKQYSDRSSDFLSTTTSYKYTNGLSLKPTEITSANSKKEVTKVINTYANDYKGISVYDKMVARNIIEPVIQQSYYTNNKLVLRKKTNYSPTAADLLLPATIERALFSNVTADIEVVYSKYDEKGNLLEYYTKDGVIHTILWGYNGTLPVAEIVGCDYARAMSFITPALLNNIDEQQLRAGLNNIRTGLSSDLATVTTYTYAPLVGMTSITDPTGKTSYYQYDELNRLKVIKDKDGKILKQYDYQYQVPLTQ